MHAVEIPFLQAVEMTIVINVFLANQDPGAPEQDR